MALFDGTTDAPLLLLEVNGAYLNDFTLDSSLLDGPDLLGPNETWTALPIDSDVLEIAIRRGRQSEDQTTDAGQMIVEVDNISGDYNPDNASASNPYGTSGRSWFRGKLPGRLRATWGLDSEYLFTGLLTDVVCDLGSDPTAVLTFSDGLAVMAEFELTGWVPLAETTAVRANRVLDAMGWPSSARSIIGDRMLQASTSATTALGVLQECALAEGGRLHVDRNGSLVMTRREAESPKTPALLLSDDDLAGSADYVSIKTSPGIRTLINVATVDNGVLDPTTVRDTSSIADTRTLRSVNHSTLLSEQADVDGLATYFATRRSSAATRVESVVIEALKIGDAWEQLIPLDLGDWITAKRTATNGIGLSAVVAAEGIEHTIRAETWRIGLHTAPVDTSARPFTLDSSLLDGPDLLTARSLRL